MKKNTAFSYTEKIEKFWMPKISFFGIFSYQVIVSSSKIYNFCSRKIALPMMYDKSVFIYFPRSSLGTNKHTKRQKNNKNNPLFCETEKIKKFRRPKISFFGIFSYQVIVSGSKIDNFGSWKIAHPAMYHSSIPIDFPRSS